MALVTETTDNRPEAVTFAFGRIFYAGVEGGRWNSTIFYSQVLTDRNRAGKCYQDADPTAEEINSIIDSDGGTIKIPEVGKVIRLVTLTTTLVIIADNGVWIVNTGSDGFSPLTFIVSRITNIGALSKRSVINVEDTAFYVAEDGIYQVGASPESRRIEATNITEPLVDSHFRGIGRDNLVNSVSVYDNKEKVYSLYYGPVNDLTGALNFKLKKGIWYPYSFDTDSEDLPSRFRLSFPFYSPRSREGIGIKFLTYSDDDTDQLYSVSEMNDASFRDFGSALMPAHLEMPPLTLDNPQFDKSAMYATHYFEITEQAITGVDSDGKAVYSYPSSALMTPQWEWHTTSGGNRVGRQRQVYRFREPLAEEDGSFDLGTDVAVSRDKIRGHGKALSLRYDAEDGKDMRLLGVTLPISMDGQY